MIPTPLVVPPSAGQTLAVDGPELPSAIRYVDDFTDLDHHFSALEDDVWPLSINGSMRNLKFVRYSNDMRLKNVLKAFAADRIARFAPGTTLVSIDGIALFDSIDIIAIIESRPEDARAAWDRLRAKRLSTHGYRGLKALLSFVAESRIGAWTPLYLSFISSALPLPGVDKYAAVRGGNVFIPVEDESKLVRWISNRAIAARTLTIEQLIDTALVVCSYQFAMRPKQIGLIKRKDCRILRAPDGGVSVHITFRMIKQRTLTSARIPLIRKVKREWTMIFSEIYDRSALTAGEQHFLGYEDAATISKQLNRLLLEITGSSWSATDLRHSGAMRQVDAGASAEDLAEFMGHSTLESGLVYYDTSATQAQRVNEALGISTIYQNLAKLGNEHFISPDELSRLKGDQQVGGVPHGISIAGIGACQAGQPSCPYNPVTACYGCPKFIPVADLAMHRGVLAEFRGVVKFFYDSSRGEMESPAYLQLKRTIFEVTSVITELEHLHGK
jgi:integrase